MNRRDFLKRATVTAMAGYLYGCSRSEQKQSLKRPNILICIADDASYSHMALMAARG